MLVAASMRLAALVLLAASGGRGEHACEAEVSSACPDRPAADIAACLKNPSEHETETTLSSECTDFVALNSACSEDIEKHCDGSFFTGDTVLCLKTWTDPESLSTKCSNVMKWAIPAPPEEETSEEGQDGPTDELGMSDKDRQEKKEWQEKRKAARGDAIERMKMKERDAKKEVERVALENFKREKPEEYAAMIQQQEEERKQQQEQKRRERLAAAALERKRRIAAEQEEADQSEESSGKRKKKKSKGGSRQWLSSLWTIAGAIAVFCGLFYVVSYLMGGGKSSGRPRGKKRR